MDCQVMFHLGVMNPAMCNIVERITKDKKSSTTRTSPPPRITKYYKGSRKRAIFGNC